MMAQIEDDPCDEMLTDRQAIEWAAGHWSPLVGFLRHRDVYANLSRVWGVSREEAKYHTYKTLYGG